MSYLVLARKWRPKTFDDLIGQENISLTLKNAIATKKLAQALIFSGPRGVGKTSTARIVAKTLNCQNEDPTKRPCADSPCTFCREISEGKSFDVQEIDAASHTGVNDIREIIGNVKYLPTSGTTKVYIIDEVHMLSQAAFNALLKTLEEPPDHVLFILATTEIHKIPATILSRCQRYDFRKIPVVKVKETLQDISEQEGIDVDEKTLYLISKEADGSLRDALSLMDQLIATFGENIKHDEAVTVLGLLESSYVKSVLSEIINRNPGKCIEYLQKAFEFGINPKKFSEELTRTLRAALFIKISGKDIVLDFSDDEKQELAELVKDEDTQGLELLFKLMLEGSENIQRSYYPEMALESSVVGYCMVNRSIPIEDIIKKINTLSTKIGSGGTGTPEPGPARNPEPKRTGQKKNPTEEPGPPKGKILKDNTADYSGEFGASTFTRDDFLKRIKETNTMMGIHLEKASSVEQIDSSIIIKFPSKSINYSYITRPAALKTLKDLAGKIYNLNVVIELDESGNSSEGTEKVNEPGSASINDDAVVKQALEIFEGRIISTKYKSKE